MSLSFEDFDYLVRTKRKGSKGPAPSRRRCRPGEVCRGQQPMGVAAGTPPRPVVTPAIDDPFAHYGAKITDYKVYNPRAQHTVEFRQTARVLRGYKEQEERNLRQLMTHSDNLSGTGRYKDRGFQIVNMFEHHAQRNEMKTRLAELPQHHLRQLYEIAVKSRNDSGRGHPEHHPMVTTARTPKSGLIESMTEDYNFPPDMLLRFYTNPVNAHHFRKDDSVKQA